MIVWDRGRPARKRTADAKIFRASRSWRAGRPRPRKKDPVSPDLATLRFFTHHRVAGFTLKRFCKGRKVGERPVNAKLRQGVRISSNHQTRKLRTHVRRPRKCIAQEEALLGCEPVDICRTRLSFHRLLKSRIRYDQPTQVCDRLALHKFSVLKQTLLDFETVDFKQTLYLSKVYEALERLDGVDSVFVRRFKVAGASAQPQDDIAPNGLIQMGENQIPVPGALLVDVSGGV